MNKTMLLTAVSALAMMASAFPAAAQETHFGGDRWQIRGRMIGVVPDESSTVSAGGDLGIGNAVVPEVDISYFFTENIAAELIAATSQHSIKHSALGDLGDAWALPPTLTLQYHFTPNNAFSPDIGAGVNYTVMYGEDEAAGINKLEVDNGFGWALQAGADYWINNNWGVNLDVKKIWVSMDASVNSGAITADVDLDPWVIGAGVSYRF